MIDVGALLDAAPKPKVAVPAPIQPTTAKPSQAASPTKEQPKGQAMPPQRTLVFREGTSDKFWRGELGAKSFTASWGRRGTQAQSKTQSFPTADAARKPATFCRNPLDFAIAQRRGRFEWGTTPIFWSG